MKKITSLANPEIKRVRALALRKNREESGLFVAEGLRHALEAAEAGWDIDTLLVEESVRDKDLVRKLLAHAGRAQVLEVSPEIMESVTRRDNAQTVVAVVRQKWGALDEVRDGVWIALEEIRDPGNLGTILRTGDAVNAAGIILIGHTCDPFSSEAVRASMGSFPHLRLVRCTQAEFLAKAARGFQVVGTHLRTDHDFRAVAYAAPLILVMGNEQAGMTESLRGACTHVVKIPMRGRADSLNVSVATAVMLYEITKGPSC